MSSQSHAHILFPRRAFIEYDLADRVFNLVENYLSAQMHGAGISSKVWRVRLKSNLVLLETHSEHRKYLADLIDGLSGIKKLDTNCEVDEFCSWHLHGIKLVLANSFVSEIAYRALAREWLA